jgi:hypothetical protein
MESSSLILYLCINGWAFTPIKPGRLRYDSNDSTDSGTVGLTAAQPRKRSG